jgi:hypothetical protein
VSDRTQGDEVKSEDLPVDISPIEAAATTDKIQPKDFVDETVVTEPIESIPEVNNSAASDDSAIDGNSVKTRSESTSTNISTEQDIKNASVDIPKETKIEDKSSS